MYDLKYITGDFPSDHGSITSGIIFHACLTHSAVAARMGVTNVLGAGFFFVEADDNGSMSTKVYGDSNSLKVKSRPEDSYLLDKVLGIGKDR